MTAKAALVAALLRGDVINIKNGFTSLGLTNIPREIGRSIERPFGVSVSRVQKDGKNRFKQPCVWVDYRLNRTEYNAPGIEKMKKYLDGELKKSVPKTEDEARLIRQLKMFV